MRDLNGKVAWITGAGTGIGSGAAIALASAGMQVVLSGRREEKLKEVAAACTAMRTLRSLMLQIKTTC